MTVDFVFLSSQLLWGYSGVNDMDFIPHTALGPHQIYSYPWQAVIRDLERDFAESTRILAVSFLSLLRESARGQGWDHKARTHTHWDHWVEMHCHFKVCRQQANCSGFCDITLHKTSSHSWHHSLQLWGLSVCAITDSVRNQFGATKSTTMHTL